MTDDDSVNFMMAEYQQLADSFHDNEDIGDKRVNLFITILTAIIGGLAIFQAKPLSDFLSYDTYVAILFLGTGSSLLFGILTFFRIIKRNASSDKCLEGMDRIKQYFIEQRNSQIREYLEFPPKIGKRKNLRKEKWGKPFSFGSGGLVQTIALLNSLIVSCMLVLPVVSFFQMAEPSTSGGDVMKDLPVTENGPVKLLRSGIVITLGIGGFLVSWLVHYCRWYKIYENFAN